MTKRIPRPFRDLDKRYKMDWLDKRMANPNLRDKRMKDNNSLNKEL